MDDDGAEIERVTILCPLLPGHHPDRTNPADIGIAGGALGELDCALASLHLAVTPPAFTYGDLHAIHPAVTDPIALPDAIGSDDEQRRQLRTLFATVMAAVPGLYAALPQQLIHNDCSVGNVLIAAGQATGILDFEFAARDLRAIDFVVGLYFIALNQALQQGSVIWERVEAFCRGYGAWVHLTAEEIAALPMLLRLRSLVGLIHWTGRARVGVAMAAEAAGYRDDALRVDVWLSAEGDTCITRVAQWLDEGSRLQTATP
jgi:homoserine kinase type II